MHRAHRGSSYASTGLSKTSDHAPLSAKSRKRCHDEFSRGDSATTRTRRSPSFTTSPRRQDDRYSRPRFPSHHMEDMVDSHHRRRSKYPDIGHDADSRYAREEANDGTFSRRGTLYVSYSNHPQMGTSDNTDLQSAHDEAVAIKRSYPDNTGTQFDRMQDWMKTTNSKVAATNADLARLTFRMGETDDFMQKRLDDIMEGRTLLVEDFTKQLCDTSISNDIDFIKLVTEMKTDVYEELHRVREQCGRNDAIVDKAASSIRLAMNSLQHTNSKNKAQTHNITTHSMVEKLDQIRDNCMSVTNLYDDLNKKVEKLSTDAATQATEFTKYTEDKRNRTNELRTDLSTHIHNNALDQRDLRSNFQDLHAAFDRQVQAASEDRDELRKQMQEQQSAFDTFLHKTTNDKKQLQKKLAKRDEIISTLRVDIDLLRHSLVDERKAHNDRFKKLESTIADLEPREVHEKLDSHEQSIMHLRDENCNKASIEELRSDFISSLADHDERITTLSNDTSHSDIKTYVKEEFAKICDQIAKLQSEQDLRSNNSARAQHDFAELKVEVRTYLKDTIREKMQEGQVHLRSYLDHLLAQITTDQYVKLSGLANGHHTGMKVSSPQFDLKSLFRSDCHPEYGTPKQSLSLDCEPVDLRTKKDPLVTPEDATERLPTTCGPVLKAEMEQILAQKSRNKWNHLIQSHINSMKHELHIQFSQLVTENVAEIQMQLSDLKANTDTLQSRFDTALKSGSMNQNLHLRRDIESIQSRIEDLDINIRNVRRAFTPQSDATILKQQLNNLSLIQDDQRAHLDALASHQNELKQRLETHAREPQLAETAHPIQSLETTNPSPSHPPPAPACPPTGRSQRPLLPMPPLNSPQITETQHPVPIQGPQRLWIHRQNVTQSDQVDLEVQRQQQAQSQPHIYNYTQHLQQLQWQQQQLVQHEYERQRHQQLQGNANLGITELMGHVHSTNPGL